MKKNKHPSPREYRIVYRAGNSLMKSEQYYNVFHSSEALEDIYHTFHKGKIHAKKITIHKIEERNRFTNKWEPRMDKALGHSGDEVDYTLEHNKVILRRKT